MGFSGLFNRFRGQDNGEDTKTGDKLARRGESAVYDENFEAAAEDLEQALEFGVREFDLPTLYTLLGRAYDRLGRSDESVQAHQQALALNPDFHNAWNNLGIALSRQGKTDAARDCYEKAIALAPDYAYAYGSLGSALIKQGNPEKAVVVLEKGADLDASIPILYGNLALAYAMVGRYEEAHKTLRQATALGYKNWREIQKRIENLQELGGDSIPSVKKQTGAAPTPLELDKLRIAMLPSHCPSCAALVSLSGVTWVGQLEALCPYCGVQLIRALDD